MRIARITRAFVAPGRIILGIAAIAVVMTGAVNCSSQTGGDFPESSPLRQVPPSLRLAWRLPTILSRNCSDWA